MQPTRAQAEELRTLSTKLFGASSRWQKLLRDTPILAGNEEYGKKTKEYKAALAEHLANSPGEMFQPPKRSIYREPTIDELLNSLRLFSDRMDYQSTQPEVVAEKAAAEFVAKKLSVPILLDVSEQEQEEFDRVVSEIGGEQSEWIKKMMTQNVQQAFHEGMVRVPGLPFARAVLAKAA